MYVAILAVVTVAATGWQVHEMRAGLFSVSADESGRSLDAWDAGLVGAFRPSVWLPLHRAMLGVAFALLPDLFLAPRVLTVLLGIALVLATATLAKKWCGGAWGGIVAAAVVAVQADRFILSCVPLSEVLYLSLVLGGAAWMGLSSDPKGRLLGGAALWMAAAAVRYEGWVLVLALVIVTSVGMVRRSIPRRTGMLSIAVGLSFPILWLTAHLFDSGDLGFVSASAGRFGLLHGDGFWDTVARSVPAQVIASWPRNGLLAGLAVALLLRGPLYERAGLALPALGLGFLLIAIVSLIGVALPSHNFWRTAALWNLLLLVFLIWGLDRLRRRGGWASFLAWTIVAILLVTEAWDTSRRAAELSSVPSAFSRCDLQAGRYLRRRLDADARRAVVGDVTWQHIHVRVASNYPERVYPLRGGDPFRPKNTAFYQEGYLDLHAMRRGGVDLLALHEPTSRNLMSAGFPLRPVASFRGCGNRSWIVSELPARGR